MTQSVSVRRLFAAGSLLVLAACSSDSVSTMAPGPDGTANAAEQAQDRLEAAFQRSSPEVMAVAGTVFADNDERIGKLVIGVENMRAIGGVRAAMARAGVAESDYEVELTQPIVNMVTLRDRFRPTVNGIQVHFGQYVCSLGANVDHAGGRSFIINSHCTNTQGGTEGTTYAQPTRTVDPTIIATEVDDPIYVKNGPGCPKGKKCRHSDASRALYSADVASSRGEIAITTGVNTGSLTVAGSGFITGQDNTTKNFPIGTVVNKVGRTTGWTRGQVTRTCVNTSVSGSTVYLFCQTFVSDPGGATVVSGGDSGSGVWTGSSSSATLVGLLWGGSSDNKQFVFSPLASVQQELG
ncbi:MAG TPA: hypothetical protein VFO66_14670, partial [Gemmatimonadaceae bacterium]|nr:hypothetical protein [Gemmatimonadaceae bacterium]